MAEQLLGTAVPPPLDFGEPTEVERLRVEKGWSQKVLAHKARVHVGMVARMEAEPGFVPDDPYEARRVAEVLGSDAVSLFGAGAQVLCRMRTCAGTGTHVDSKGVVCEDHWLTRTVWPLPFPEVDSAEVEEGWADRGTCIRQRLDPELWYPQPGSNGTPPAAVVKACAACPVRGSCAIVALKEPKFLPKGIRGGMTQKTLELFREHLLRRGIVVEQDDGKYLRELLHYE